MEEWYMSRLDGDQQLTEALNAFRRIALVDKPELTAATFQDMAWGMGNLAAGLQWALNDIHNHVRAQQPGTQPTGLSLPRPPTGVR
jgi:hypothetical protein